ncbi:hypothetical protein L6164_027962 [Bauhinia variegata]|uniref:Uncharacterized protein n=1 Tax=Bauhinia variegata TaxID=167791 RepID=A0ACB9LUY6_BAUVA|nr:hypothetical protein L6164_027962 [Bauhinia variegata]
MGTRRGARVNKWRAVSKAWAASTGLGPQEGCQNLCLETLLRIDKTGRLSRIWSCWGEDERQFGKSGEMGSPTWSIDRRSGGKQKLCADSTVDNSASDSPSATGIFADWSRSITALA